MSTESATDQHPSERAHNHPARCCCSTDHQTDENGSTVRVHCPVCPEHGWIAGVYCPHCHQPAGRPHTDYCPGRLARDPWATTNREYPGQPGIAEQYATCTRPASNHGDGRGCDDDHCPRHGEPDSHYPCGCSYALADTTGHICGLP